MEKGWIRFFLQGRIRIRPMLQQVKASVLINIKRGTKGSRKKSSFFLSGPASTPSLLVAGSLRKELYCGFPNPKGMTSTPKRAQPIRIPATLASSYSCPESGSMALQFLFSIIDKIDVLEVLCLLFLSENLHSF